MKLKKYALLLFVITNSSYLLCDTFVFLPQVTIKEDPYVNLRSFLYKMENNLDAIEDIHKYKIFYSVILENHIADLKKDDQYYKILLWTYSTCFNALPAGCFVTITPEIVMDYIKYKRYYSHQLQGTIAAGLLAAYIAFWTCKIHSYISDSTNAKIEIDQRVINKLNQL